MAGWQDTIAVGSADTTDQLGEDLTIMAKLTIAGDGTVTKIRWWQSDGASGAGTVEFALYDNSTPKVLLGSAPAVSQQTGGSAAYIESTLSVPVAVSASQVVWLAINNETDTAFDARYLNGGATNATYKFEAYAGFPSTPWTADGDLTRTYVASAYLEDPGVQTAPTRCIPKSFGTARRIA